MICLWEDFLRLLPPAMVPEADSLGRDRLRELRLRLGDRPEYILPDRRCQGRDKVTRQTLDYCVNAASRYSPWAAATAARGYITAPGGHRVGICGHVVRHQGVVTGIRDPTSLCLRVARDFPGIGRGGVGAASTLILGPPGWGKTTLLRDICREIGNREEICVVDERGELFPQGFSRGKHMDVLTGCGKGEGLEMALRTMTPRWLAVDEITSREDSDALVFAANCGVRLLATAHAASAGDLKRRSCYRPLVEEGIFERVLVLHPDQSWHGEGITP